MKWMPMRKSPTNQIFFCATCGKRVWFCGGMSHRVKDKRLERAYCGYQLCPYCGVSAEGTDTKPKGVDL